MDSPQVSLPYRSKADLVTEYLRNEIQSGRPGAGQRLVLSQVADRLGVSKVPVREAVTRLAGEGLLQILPNIGAVVPEFTRHEVLETALLRVAVEGLALEQAFDRHDGASLEKVRAHLARMSEEQEHFHTLNAGFHLALMEPCPYREVVRNAIALLKRAERYRTAAMVPGYREDAMAEHVAMFECVARGKRKDLLSLNERHILGAAKQLMAQMP